jgi:hypothetical protein
MAVAEVAAREHESGQRHRVAVHDPLQARDVRAEIGAQARQGDVDDRHVEQDEEHPDAHDDERERALAVGHGSTVGPRRFASRRRMAELPSIS